jgi:hypothetical protein
MKMTPEEAIAQRMKTAALKAGLVDLDVLKLVDLTSVKLTEAGEVEGADALLAKLQKDKPHFFVVRKAKDMSEQERAAKLAELRKGPAPEPMDLSKTAAEMTLAARAAWIREHSRRTG